MAPDSNIICKDKIKRQLLQLHITHCCIIDSKSVKKSAWGLVYKPGSLIHLKIFFMVIVTQREAEIGRNNSGHRCK